MPRILADQPSLIVPGARSLISEPLDGIVTYDQFSDELVGFFKRPPHKDNLTVELIEEAGNDKTFSIVCNTSAGPGTPASTSVRKYYVDGQNNVLIEEEHIEEVLARRIYTVLHKEPLRVEIWAEMPERREIVFDPLLDLYFATSLKMLSGAVFKEVSVSLSGYGWKEGLICSVGKAYMMMPALDGSDNLSVITSSLDKYIDQDTLFQKTLAYLKDAQAEKSVLLEETDAGFKVFVQMSPEMKVIRNITYDKAAYKIIVETTINDVLVETSHTIVHRDPVRFEEWGIGADDGKRYAGRMHTYLMQEMLDSIVGYGVRKAMLYPDRPSPSDEGKRSMVTDALDDLIDFDKLWDALVANIRTPLPDRYMKMKKCVELPGSTDTAFTLQITSLTDNDPPAISMVDMRVALDKAQGLLTIDLERDGVHDSQTCLKLHRSPLRLEIWLEKDGNRLAGLLLSGILQLVHVDRIFGMHRCPGALAPREDASPGDPKARCSLLDLPRGVRFEQAWAWMYRSVKIRFAADIVTFVKQEAESDSTMRWSIALDPGRMLRERGLGDGFTPIVLQNTVSWDKTKGELHSIFHIDNIGVVRTEHSKVHAGDPCRIEFWKSGAALRRHDAILAAVVQGSMDEVLRRACARC